MRKLAWLLIFFASPAFAAPAIVQVVVPTTITSGGAKAITLTSAPVSGDDLYLMLNNTSATGAITGIAQTGFTWARVVTDAANSKGTEIWHAHATGGTATALTMSVSGTLTAGTYGIVVLEFSGVITTTVTNAVSSGSGTVISPTITPASGSALLLAVGRAGGVPAATNGNPAAGWTSITPDSGDTRGVYAYAIVATTSGSYSPAWTAGTGTYDSVIGSYLNPSSGPAASSANFFMVVR